MRPEGPATLRAASFRRPSKLLSRHFRNRTTAPVRQHSSSERHIYRCSCCAAIPGITARQHPRRLAAQPSSQSGEVEEAAMPGQPACAYALLIFPRQFTLENRRSAASLAAIIVWQASEGPTFSVNPLCGRLLRAAIEKHFVLVQKLWTIGLPCGRLRKTAENSSTRNPQGAESP
jgi:hypothetical protein